MSWMRLLHSVVCGLVNQANYCLFHVLMTPKVPRNFLVLTYPAKPKSDGFVLAVCNKHFNPILGQQPWLNIDKLYIINKGQLPPLMKGLGSQPLIEIPVGLVRWPRHALPSNGLSSILIMGNGSPQQYFPLAI